MMRQSISGGRSQGMGFSRAPGTRLATSAPLAGPAQRRAGAPRGRQAPRRAADTHQQAAAAAADEGADPMARLTRELEALRRENELLKAQLSELKGGAPASAPAAAPAGAAAGAAAAAAAGVVTAAVGASASAAAAAASAVAGAVAAAVAPAKEAGRARGEPAQQAMAGGPEAFLRRLESGIAWPDPGSKFWDAPPRKERMPVDIGEGLVSVPPRDARQMQIVHFTAELAPIAKVGGLGDVVTGLARTCLARGHAVRVFLPYYECLPADQVEGLKHEMDLSVPKGRFWDGAMQLDSIPTSVFSARIAGVPVWLVRPAEAANSGLFRGSRIYGGSYNETEAYLYFCRAGLEFLRASGQQPDIIHLHEWQTCAAAMLYWEVYHPADLHKPRVVLTIHNMDNTGEVRQDEFAFTGVPGEPFATIDKALDERTIGHNPERLNLMKGGIVYSNAVTTVSPSYANEILTGGAAGWLRGTLTKPEVRPKMRGILNGIDVTEWNPATDAKLAANYNAQFPAGKALCKKFLQRGLGLDQDASKPLVAVITRLVPQKGIHLIKAAIYRTLEQGGQFVLLGSGHCDGDFRRLAENEFKGHPDVRLNIFYSEALSHQIYAAADIVLVPSMFEPCGLTQMIGMRYGAVPVVRRTGGLGDTVRDVAAAPAGEGNGYVFDGTDEGSLHGALDRALRDFKSDPDAWFELARNNLNADMSWAKPSADYIAVYGSL